MKNNPTHCLVHFSFSQYFSIEVGYLKLSQFPYNCHQFNYNFYSSPLGTIGFLTSGIRAVHLEAVVETKSTILLDKAISIFQEVQKQLSIILKKLSNAKTRRQQPQAPRSNENYISINALAITFPKSIKVDFPRFNGEEHAAWVYKANQYFNHYKTPYHEKLPMAYFYMDGEALVWFEDAEDTGLFVSWGAFVQALQVRLGSIACDTPLKATIQEPLVLVSNPTFIGVSQTHVSPDGSVHTIKNEDVDLPHNHVGGQISLLSGCHKAKELDASFLGDSYGINDGFYSRDDCNFYKKLCSILMKVKFNTTTLRYAPMSWVVINCFGAICVINGQDALVYWVSGWFPLMNVLFHNNTLWARCFQGEGNLKK